MSRSSAPTMTCRQPLPMISMAISPGELSSKLTLTSRTYWPGNSLGTCAVHKFLMLLLVVANFRWKVFGWNLPISTAETGEITITYGVYDFAGNPAVSVKRCVDSFRVIARVVTTVVLVEGQMMINHCVHVKETKLESSNMFILDFLYARTSMNISHLPIPGLLLCTTHA